MQANETAITETPERSVAVFAREGRCPLFKKDTGRCLASDRSLKVSAKRRQRCCSEDYDDCSAYLGYLLRHTTPLRNDNDWFDVR